MKTRRMLAGILTATVVTFVVANSQAQAFNFSTFNPFAADKPLGRLTGTIKPPRVSDSLKKMNEGTLKVLSGTKDILFPWATRSKDRDLPDPPAPTGSGRVYPASDRPNS